MLDQKVFLQGLNYLKAMYINWSFDLNNNIAIQIWYKKFSQLDNEIYMQLLEQYTDNNIWGPNSPSDILDLIKTPNNNGVEAWEWILALNQQYPLDNEFQKPKFYQELKKDNVAFKLFEMLHIEDVLKPHEEITLDDVVKYTKGTNKMFYGFGSNYCKDKFIKWYDHEKQPQHLLQIGVAKNLLSM